MTEKKQAAPYPIRPSAELRRKLEEAARVAGRTLHSEIIARLEASFVDVPRQGDVVDPRINLRQLVIEEIENYLHPAKENSKAGGSSKG